MTDAPDDFAREYAAVCDASRDLAERLTGNVIVCWLERRPGNQMRIGVAGCMCATCLTATAHKLIDLADQIAQAVKTIQPDAPVH